jgi:CheY-like chemotaxis protein
MARILVADDEADVRQLCRDVLERSGHQIVEAATGAETLDFLKSDTADLVILDVMLPGVDGYTIQLEMAKDEKTRRIPVIVLTALHPTKAMFAKFAQVREFVMKPFDPTELGRLVEKVLAAPVKHG